MAGIGTGEIIAILIIALLIFGPRKLPELGKSLGTGLREFKRNTKGLKEEFDLNLKTHEQHEQESQISVSQPAENTRTAQSGVEQSHRQKIRAQDAIAKPSSAVNTEKS